MQEGAVFFRVLVLFHACIRRAGDGEVPIRPSSGVPRVVCIVDDGPLQSAGSDGLWVHGRPTWESCEAETCQSDRSVYVLCSHLPHMTRGMTSTPDGTATGFHGILLSSASESDLCIY